MKLRILTYNIHGAKGVDGRRDYLRIGKFLKEQNIDVALIQELDTRPVSSNTDDDILSLQTDHFPYFSAAPTITLPSGWYGNAILSRHPIIKETIIDISHDGREPRNILEIFIQTKRGQLHIVNTHKGLRPSERGQQMKKLNDLLSRQSDLPLVVGGDINEWQTYAGALRRLNKVLHPIPSGATFPTRFPVLNLDRMWCRPENLILKSQVLKTKETRIYSDHYPLLIEIELPEKEAITS